MTLNMVYGNLGSGKTLLLVDVAYRTSLSNQDQVIYANFHIDLPNVVLIKPSDLADITHGKVLLDEMYLWMDSRRSVSKGNISLSHDIFKSRKRGLDIWGTAQLTGSVDLRFVNLMDQSVHAEGLKIKQQKEFIYKWFNYRWYHAGYATKGTLRLPLTYAEKHLFPIYDTTEFPDETVDELEISEKIQEKVSEVSEVIMKELGENSQKVTKGVVRSFLMEMKEPLHLAEDVYNYIKRVTLTG